MKRHLSKFMLLFSLSATSHVLANSEQLVIADVQGDWGVLSPYLHLTRGPGYVYTSFIFDTLLWKDTQGELQPALAQSWRYEQQQNCYHFTLNLQAKWHDGQAITAQDVVFTFNYMQQHAYRHVDLSPLSTITATADDAVALCLSYPYAPFLVNIAASLPILPQHIYQSINNPTKFVPQQIIGSGPYKLKDYNRTQGNYLLERYDDYYQGRAKFAQLKIIKTNPNVSLKAMQQGEIDIITLPYPLAQRFKQAKLPIVSQLSYHPHRILFNHQQRFSHTDLRRGLAYLINRPELVAIAYQNHANVAQVGYRQDRNNDLAECQYTFNPETAEQLLIRGGWQKNSQGKWMENQQPITLVIVGQPRSERLSKALAAQLEAGGFVISLHIEQDVQLAHRIKQQDFDLALLTTSHVGDPDRFRRAILGQQQWSENYHRNSELLALLEQQKQEINPVAREALISQAEKLYCQDLPSFPLVDPINYAAFNAQKIDLKFTTGGIAMGIPLPLNKQSLFFAPTE